MDEPTRRAWSRPELIVLVRSGPEEAVLTTCKVVGGVQADVTIHIGCTKVTDACLDCYARVAS